MRVGRTLLAAALSISLVACQTPGVDPSYGLDTTPQEETSDLWWQIPLVLLGIVTIALVGYEAGSTDTYKSSYTTPYGTTKCKTKYNSSGSSTYCR